MRVALHPDERHFVDQHARRLGISQSEVVRMGLSMLRDHEAKAAYRRRRCQREWLIDPAGERTDEDLALLMGDRELPPEPPDEKRLELDRDELRFIVARDRANLSGQTGARQAELEQRIEWAELLKQEAESLLAMLEADTSGYLARLDTPRAPGKVHELHTLAGSGADVPAALDWHRRVMLMRNHLEQLAS